MQQGALVVIAAGASASLVLPLYLTELRETQGEIVVLLTRSAERFVPREVVGWLADEVITSDSPTLNPIKLALTSKGIVVLPATAHMLAARALGPRSTPAATTLLAAPRPVPMVSHMNKVMWDEPRHPTARGEPARGRRHCGGGENPVSCTEMWRGAHGDGVSMAPPGRGRQVIVSEWLDERP